VVQEWLSSLNPGVALDAGTGTGLYREIIESSGHHAVGVDLSREMLLVQKQSSANAVLVQGSLEALPFTSSSFNYVLCTRVLTHVPSLRLVFGELARVLNPGGRLLLADIHPEHPYSKMSVSVDRRKVSIKIRKYSMAELRDSIVSAGLKVIDFRSFGLGNLLWNPPRHGFENIYQNPSSSIFYVALVCRP
jgi:ubiquinone/menaquinone biosynthesis C-methylase UbiE